MLGDGGGRRKQGKPEHSTNRPASGSRRRSGSVGWRVLAIPMGPLSGAAGKAASSIMVPLTVIAETCSWYSVLTTSNIGHVMEESLWGLGAALLAASLMAIWPRCARHQRALLALWCVAGVAYVVFMFLVDVPMYWSRWMADEAVGRQYVNT